MLAKDGSLARAEAARRRLALVQARAGAQTAQARVAALKSTIQRLGGTALSGVATLSSPIGGVVVSTGVTPGETVDTSAEALKIADLSVVLVMAQIPEASVPLIAPGAPADMRLPIVIRLAPEARANVQTIRTLPVGLSNGHAVPLSAVADIGVADGPAQIERDKLQRRIDVDINVSGRDIQSFVTEAQRNIARNVKLPSGYTLEWGGTFQNLQSATARLAIVVPGVLALLFLMLYLNFGSLRISALIFLNVPMAATGGVAALMLRGMPFSVSAGIGFISTFGIAILDGVVLASYIQEERDRGCDAGDAARDAANKRLRPVLTTALVASIGFLPMAVSTSAGSEVQRPLATVVIGGLISATLLTLLVLPALYPVFVGARRRRTVTKAKASLLL